MANEYEGMDSGTLFQREKAVREEYNRTKCGDEGERENAALEHELKAIQQEWQQRSDR